MRMQIITYLSLFFGFAGTALALHTEKRLGNVEYHLFNHITDGQRATHGF